MKAAKNVKVPAPDVTRITALLREWSRGDAGAGEQVATLIYGELHRRAAAHIRRERHHHTLSPSDLLHDVFLQLARQHVEWANRGQFYGTACQMMRRALVDHARARSRAKRGGLRVELTDDLVAVAPADIDVMALDAALTELGRIDERQVRLVELRFFAGLTLQEAADALGMSLATANRDWRFARAWLFNRLSSSRDTPSHDS
jgi:RNA polymerase sigma-70 factor (ECF subfamily)